MFAKSIALLALVGCAAALNACFDQWERVTDIDLAKFTGDWILYETNYDAKKCPKTQMNATNVALGKFDVSMTEKVDGSWVTFIGDGVVKNGEFVLSMDELPGNFVEFTVLGGGDFKLWAMIMNCIEVNNKVVPRATLVVRPKADETEIARATEDIKRRLGLDFKPTERTAADCAGSP